MIKVVYYKCSCGYNGAEIFEGQWNRQCTNCGAEQGFYKIKYNPKDIQKFSDCNVAGMMEEHPRYSMALGVFDEDLAEAKRVHPQAEWKKFGNSWRPLIRNRVDKLRMLKQAKMTEY